MENSTNSEPKIKSIAQDLIYQGEAFNFRVITDKSDITESRSVLGPCFGRFTKCIDADTLVREAEFRYYITCITDLDHIVHYQDFLIDTNTPVRQPYNNSIVIAKRLDFTNELSWLRRTLDAYFPNFTVYENHFEFSWLRGSQIQHHTNMVLGFQFNDMYMWEIFCVLQCFRQYCQLTSNFSYMLAKKLYCDKWHNLSFLQILFLTHLLPLRIPGDQKIGRSLVQNQLNEWITVDTIRENHTKHLHLPPYYNLSIRVLPMSSFKQYKTGRWLSIPSDLSYTTPQEITPTPPVPEPEWTIKSMEDCYNQLKFD